MCFSFKCDTGVTFGENNSNCSPVNNLRKGKFRTGAEFEKGEAMGNEREQTTIRLPAELKDQLQREADSLGVPLHDLIVFILWEGLRCTPPR